MKFAIDGTEYDVNLDSLTFDEADVIEEYAGYSDVLSFGRAVQETRTKALRALVWLAKRRNGEDVEWADIGSIDIMELTLSILDLNGIDIKEAANGENPEAVATLSAMLEQRRAQTGNRTQRRAK